MKIQPSARIVVCDGGRYVIYENKGDIDHLDLRVAESASIDNPPARDHGDDRPGRFPSPDGQRSAVGQTDKHDMAEQRFIGDLAERIARWTSTDHANHFLLIADPKSMGRMRTMLPQTAQDRILSSITGDYVHRPVEIIEQLVLKA